MSFNVHAGRTLHAVLVHAGPAHFEVCQQGCLQAGTGPTTKSCESGGGFVCSNFMLHARHAHASQAECTLSQHCIVSSKANKSSGSRLHLLHIRTQLLVSLCGPGNTVGLAVAALGEIL